MDALISHFKTCCFTRDTMKGYTPTDDIFSPKVQGVRKGAKYAADDTYKWREIAI